MVVRDFDFIRIPVLPPETNAILLVNPDAVLPLPLSMQQL
jgi:hypothetical protein